MILRFSQLLVAQVLRGVFKFSPTLFRRADLHLNGRGCDLRCISGNLCVDACQDGCPEQKTQQISPPKSTCQSPHEASDRCTGNSLQAWNRTPIPSLNTCTRLEFQAHWQNEMPPWPPQPHSWESRKCTPPRKRGFRLLSGRQREPHQQTSSNITFNFI